MWWRGRKQVSVSASPAGASAWRVHRCRIAIGCRKRARPCAGSGRPWPRLQHAARGHTTVRRAGRGRGATVRNRFRVPFTSQRINTIGIHTITHLIDNTRRGIIRCVTTSYPTRGVILPL